MLVTAPLLPPGFALTYDMVFVPRPRLSVALLGVSGAPPRAVPSALLAAVLSRILTGQILEKVVLFGIFALAAYGAARLVPSDRGAARVGAGLLYAWSPFTYERILLGHWALLVGFAALPWVVGAAVRFRTEAPRAGARLALAMAGAVAGGPYTGAVGGLLAIAVTGCPPREGRALGRRVAAVCGLALALNLPWLVPAVLGPAVPGRPLLAEALFRARADSPLGTLGSLLSLGGLWRTDLAPPGRTGFAWIPALLIVAGLAFAGWRLLGTRWPRGARAGLLLVAAAGMLLAAAPSLPVLDAAARWLAGLPGGGFLRDSQKFVMPYALAAALAFGLGVERVVQAASEAPPQLRRAATALALLPVALAPTLAWGASGRLFTARYPASWKQAEAIAEDDRAPGGILVLPWHAFLPFTWNRGRAVHQPALQFFSRPVLASSSLEVGRYRLPEEDPWARLAASAALGRGRWAPELGRLGIRYVLLFKEAEWADQLPRLIGLAPILDTPDLRLYRAPPARPPTFPHPPLPAILAADAVVLVVLGVAGSQALRRRHSRDVSGPGISLGVPSGGNDG